MTTPADPGAKEWIDKLREASWRSHSKPKILVRTSDYQDLIAAVKALRARITTDGLPCECRFRGVEGAIRQGSETGVLVDPDTPIEECALHKALRERVAELERERDLAVAHDRQDYPTASAYEEVCKARTKWQARTEAAEARVGELEPLIRNGVRVAQNCMEWQARATAAEARVVSLFEDIRHGDVEHEAWLEQAITDHFAGRPVERPRGMGNREAAEAREAELAGALEEANNNLRPSLDDETNAAHERAAAVLSAMPAQAMERARAVERMEEALERLSDHPAWDGEDLDAYTKWVQGTARGALGNEAG